MAVQLDGIGQIQPNGSEEESGVGSADNGLALERLTKLLPLTASQEEASVTQNPEELPQPSKSRNPSRRRRGLGVGLDLETPAQLSFSDVFVRRRASSVGVADAKSHFSEIIEKLNNGSYPPVLIHRYVEPQAAIVSIEDYYVSETIFSKLQDYVARSTNRRRSEIGVGEMLQFLDEAV